MPTCPNGHQSGSDDWCEVCGHRMAGPGAPMGAAVPPPPPGYGFPGPGGDPNATAQAELCPQCRTPREANAPFCEECRYNFLTNTATSYTPVATGPRPGLNLPAGFTNQPGLPQPGPGAPPPPPGAGIPGFPGGPGAAQQGPGGPQGPAPGGPGHDPFDYQSSRPSQLNRPAEPLHEAAGHGHQAPPPPGFPQAQQPPFGGGPGGPDPRGFQGPGGGPAGPPSAFQQPAPPQQPGPGPAAPVAPVDDWPLSPPSAPAPQGPPPGVYQPPAPPPYGGPQGPGHQGPPGGQMPGPQSPGGPGPHQPLPNPPGAFGQADAWTAVIGPDRDYFMAMMQRSGPDAGSLNLPAYSPEQRLPLTGSQITIGRRRQSTGEAPDIDLSVPPEDPGVSHKHAVLVKQSDGSWAVVDQNSTNGTTLNGAEEPIQPYVPVPLHDGDRVHVGAWTTITVHRGA